MGAARQGARFVLKRCIERDFAAVVTTAALCETVKNFSSMPESRYVDWVHFLLKGKTMKALRTTSKVLLLVAALGLSVAGCERRAANDTSGASGGASNSASGGGMGSSGASGASGTSGTSGSGSSTSK